MTRLHWSIHAFGVPFLAWVAFRVLFAETSWSRRAELTIVGATLEVAGIALLALDFWLPPVLRWVEWLTRWGVETRIRDLWWRVHSWITRRPLAAVLLSDSKVSREEALPITPRLTSPRVASFEQVSDRLQAITDRITTIEGNNAAEHERLREEMVERDRRLRADVQDWIARSKDQFLPWRVAGLVIALGGTFALAAANLVA